MRYIGPEVSIRIYGIRRTTDRGVEVELKGGKYLWMPREYINFVPGVMFYPGWLKKKIERWQKRDRKP